MRLQGQRILVTGASSGLGRALAVQMAEAGATVIATARRETRLLELAKTHPSIEPHALDLTDLDALPSFAASLGRVDGVVLNAGISHVGTFLDGTDAGDVALLDTNVAANLRLARALYPGLRGGRLVLVGSMAGFVPLPYQAVYSGTKAFVLNFGLALREEWRGRVSVGVFAPGGIRTEMTDVKRLEKLDGQMADAETVAAALLRFYASDRATAVPGASNRAVAALSRLLPRALLSRLMERVYR